ncbi:glycosyltransferase [Kineococcus sp. NBC_00420]|uniref:glycosyltransferase family 2 protein n=1 Tax=unclassified Kineococcus TaxID=2621656 RepID=UPI002E1F232C
MADPVVSPVVSVVVPCLNVVDVVDAQLKALAQQDLGAPFEVLLADNGSSDGLRERVPDWARTFGLDLHWVDASAVRGVSAARNAGLRAARADLVAVCDADDEVVPGWLRALVAAAVDATVVGGVNETTQVNDAIRTTWRPGPPAGRLPTKLDFLPYAVGCNLAVHRDAALAVGGWDETYVAGGDDVDFSWRLQLAGHELALAPGAVVHYRYRTDLRGTARQFRHYARSEARLLRDFREQGARPSRPSRSAREAKWLVRHAHHLARDEAQRGRWICRAATLLGRLEGARTYRCWVG